MTVPSLDQSHDHELLERARKYFRQALLPENAGEAAANMLQGAYRNAWTFINDKFLQDAPDCVFFDLWSAHSDLAYAELLDPDGIIHHNGFMAEFLLRNRLASIQKDFKELSEESFPNPNVRFHTASVLVRKMRLMGLDPKQKSAFDTVGLDFYEFHKHVAKSCSEIVDFLRNTKISQPLRQRFGNARQGVWRSAAGPNNYETNITLLEMDRSSSPFAKLAMDVRAFSHAVLG